MDGFELVADVVGRSSRPGKQSETIVLSCFAELWLRVSSGQGLEEFLIGRGEAVIEFVARRPECIFKRLPLAIGTGRSERSERCDGRDAYLLQFQEAQQAEEWNNHSVAAQT